MLTWVIRVCFLILGGTTGVFSLPALWVKLGIGHILLINNPYTDALIGALIFYLITFWAVKYVEAALNWLEEKLAKIAIATLVYGGLGLFVGLVIAFFASNALSQTNIPLLNSVVPVILTLVLGYLGSVSELVVATNLEILSITEMQRKEHQKKRKQKRNLRKHIKFWIRV